MKKIYISDKEKLINLPDFPYVPKYEKNITGFEEYEDMRMAYIDTGNKDSELTFLMLHGSPTWSYMWRHFIKEIKKANFRAVAFDMPGFGRSDKPLDEEAYTFTSLRSSLICMIERLNLKNIVLVVHEWGGFLGLTIPMDMPEVFDGIIIHNTTLATGTNLMSDSYTDWRNYIRDNPDLNIRAIMNEKKLTLESIVKLTVFMIDLNDFDVVNKVFIDFFRNIEYPVRSLVEVSRLPRDSKIEIDAICYANK